MLPLMLSPALLFLSSQPFVHRDLKLENLLLGEDGLVRLADFGSMCEQGDVSTAHDPTYFPPDWATLLPDGRHVCEDPASLAAANTLLLDLRGLGMALLKGFAGRLPAEVTLEDAGSFSTGSGSWGPGWGPCAGGQHTAFGEAAAGGFQPAPMSVGRGSAAGSSTASLSTGSYASSVPCSSPRCAPCSGSAAVQFDAQERARLLRIAQHDWAASIDARIPDAPALNQFVKLLMGPKEAVPSLSKFLQQPLIKSVHRQVLDTARKARKPWLAHVAACRAAAWRVVAPLAQLEQQLLQVYSDGSLSSMAPLSEQFEVLAEQYQEQQLQEQEKQQAQMQLAGASDACAHPGGGSSSSMECACSSARCAACSAQHALYCIAGAGGGRGTAAGLQAAVGSVLAQLSAARPEAASRIAQLQEELMQIAGGEYSTGAGSGAGTGSCARMQEVELRTAGACSFACATGAEPDHAGAGLFASVALQAGAAVLPDSAAAGGTLAVFDWNNSAGYDWKSSAGFGSGIPVQAQEWGLFAAGGTALQFSPAAPGLLVGAEMVQQPLGCTHARSADRPSALASITVSDPCSGVEGSDWCAPAEQAASQGAGATAGQELACAGLGQPPVQCEELLAAASAALQQALGVLQQRQAAARVLSAGAQGARADGDVLGLLAHAQAALQEARGLASSGVEPVSSGAGKAGSIKGVELPTELLSESEDCADIEVFLVESPTAAGARAPAAALGAQRKGLGASWAKPQTCGVAKRSGSGGRRGVGVGLARWVLLAAALVSVLQQHSVVKQV